MPIDAKLLRGAQAAYRQWNEAELREKLQRAGSRPADEAWRQFVDLWEFGWQMRLQASETQQRQKLNDLRLYYEQIRKLETWRKTLR